MEDRRLFTEKSSFGDRGPNGPRTSRGSLYYGGRPRRMGAGPGRRGDRQCNRPGKHTKKGGRRCTPLFVWRSCWQPPFFRVPYSEITSPIELTTSIRATERSPTSRSFPLKDGVFTFVSIPGWAGTNARTIGNPTAAHPQGLVVGYVDDGVFDTLQSFAGFIYDPVTSAFATINTLDSFFTIVHGQNVVGQIVGNIISDGSSLAFGRWGLLFIPTTGVDPMLGGTVSYFRINDMPPSARGINDKGVI